MKFFQEEEEPEEEEEVAPALDEEEGASEEEELEGVPEEKEEKKVAKPEVAVSVKKELEEGLLKSIFLVHHINFSEGRGLRSMFNALYD